MAAVFTGELSLCGRGLQDLQPTCAKPLPTGGLQHIQGQSSGAVRQSSTKRLHLNDTQQTQKLGTLPFFPSAGGKSVLWISGTQDFSRIMQSVIATTNLFFHFPSIGLFGYHPLVFLLISKIIFNIKHRIRTRRGTLEHIFQLNRYQLEFWWPPY